MLTYLFTDNPEHKKLGKFLSFLIAVLSYFIAFSNFFRTLSNEWLLYIAVLFVSLALYMVDNLNPIAHSIIVFLLLLVLYFVDENNTSSNVIGAWIMLLASFLLLILLGICAWRLENHRTILMSAIMLFSLLSSFVLIYFSMMAINA